MDQRAVRPGRQATWIEPGRLVTIDGRELLHGNFYFGSHIGTNYGESNDNGVVNPALSLGGASEFAPYNSHEPPSYRTLPPRLRRDFIEWLSTGCLERFVPEEFASIYFYGLEHRLMIDCRGQEPKMIAEIRRIARLFPGALRLQRDVARLELFLGKKTAYHSRPVFTAEMATAHRPAPSVMLYLGRRLAKEGTLDAKDAFLWAQSSFKIFFPKPYHRCRREFEALFEKRFDEAYPRGLRVNVRKALKLFHRTATWHRTVDFVLPADATNVPDIESSQGLLEQLNFVISRVAADLDAYDRLLARKPSAAQSMEAITLLPSLLHCAPWIGRFADVKKAIDDGLSKSGFISTSTASFLKMLGLDDAGKVAVPAKTSSSIAALLDAFDVGYEPDRRYGFVSLSTEGAVCLFRLGEGSAVFLEENSYRSARLLTEMAVLAAAADGAVNQREMLVLKSFLETELTIDAVRQCRLTAVAKSLMKSPLSSAGTLSALSKMPEGTIRRALDLALDIVLADGPANPKEVAFLEKLHKTLGQPVDVLHTRLHRQEADGEVLTLVQAGRRQEGVGIKRPAAPEKQADERALSGEIVIDMDRLSRIRQETETVSAMLSDIFKEEPLENADADVRKDGVGESMGGFSGLDERHGKLLALLLEAGCLDALEFETKARDLGLMPDGALETLNEWGFDNVGEAIIDDSGGIEIHSDFLESVRLKRTGE